MIGSKSTGSGIVNAVHLLHVLLLNKESYIGRGIR